MSKDSPARYYQKNKEGIQKSLVKGIKIFRKKNKTKNVIMVANDIRITQKMKNKN